MSWFNGSFRRRLPININATSSAAGSYDFELAIPVDWDDFWENIRSDGNDIMITDADGKSTIAFQFKTGFNLANRTLTLQVLGVVTTAPNVMRICQLYWDNPDQATPLTSTISISSPLTAFVYLGAPTGYVVKDVGTRPIGTVPTAIFQKEPQDKIDVWFPIGTRLSKRRVEYNQRLDFTLPAQLSCDVRNSSKGSDPSMFAIEEIRVINNWTRVRILAGTDGDDFCIKLFVFTSQAETITFNALLQIRELSAQ